MRCSELAATRVEHLEPRKRGPRLILPRFKGERLEKTVTVAIPYAVSTLRPVLALRRWQASAGITEGALFCRVFAPPSRVHEG